MINHIQIKLCIFNQKFMMRSIIVYYDDSINLLSNNIEKYDSSAIRQRSYKKNSQYSYVLVEGKYKCKSFIKCLNWSYLIQNN